MLKSGAKIQDVREYERTEVAKGLHEVQETSAHAVSHELEAQGVSLSEEQIAEQVKKANWETLRRESIKNR